MFVLAGVAGLLLMRLDLHRISFSDHGGRHDFYLSGWRQEPYLIHNSTALLGPAFVEFLRTGELETVHIDNVIESMGRPQEPAPLIKAAPAPKPAATLPEPAVRPALPPPSSAGFGPSRTARSRRVAIVIKPCGPVDWTARFCNGANNTSPHQRPSASGGFAAAPTSTTSYAPASGGFAATSTISYAPASGGVPATAASPSAGSAPPATCRPTGR